MKRFFCLIAIIISLGLNSVYSQTDLKILYFGDTHSFLAPTGPRNADLTGTQGGIARAASVIYNYENSGANVLTLHSGDFSFGDFFFAIPFLNPGTPQPELSILSSLGVDAITLGNHEFDLGPEALLYEMGTTFPDPMNAIPFLSANAQHLDLVPGLDQYVHSYTIKTFGDLKVGIFGLTTHSANSLSDPSPVVIDENFIPKAAEMTAALQGLGCQFIICLSHYGIQGDQAIASYVPGINLIVGGHDHYLIPPMQVGNTWIVQAEGFYKYIGTINFRINGTDAAMTGSEMIHLDTGIPEAPSVKNAVDEMIAGIEAAAGPVYTQRFGTSVQFMEELATDVLKPGNHTTAAGNFISDAMKWHTGTDFAIEPGGSIAQPIYKGPIVPADLFRAVGYGFNEQGPGFKVVTFKLTGLQLYTALESILTMIDNEDFLPQFSGLTLKYMPSAPAGEKIQSVKINNMPLNPMATYSVSSNQLVTMMLTQMEIEFTDYQEMAYTEFENLCAYVNYLKNKITPSREARVIAVEEELITKQGQPGVTSSDFSLGQNYPNPFNPSTVITYNVPEASKIKLSVFNVLGEEVAVLADEFRSPGNYQAVWNAASMPAGIYIYTLQADGFSQTRKMILMK